MPEPQPASEPCCEREEIVASIRATAVHIIALHNAEIGAAHNCDLGEMIRIEDDVRKALVFKASLLERYHSHLEAHGCR